MKMRVHSYHSKIPVSLIDDWIPDPPYQRDSVWCTDQQVAYIEAMFRGLALAPLLLAHRHSGEMVIVDGRQRWEAMQRFLLGHLHVDGRSNGAQFRRLMVPVAIFEGPGLDQAQSIAHEAEIYLAINCAGTGHTAEELDKARSLARVMPA